MIRIIVALLSLTHLISYAPNSKIAYFFAHGLADTHKQAYIYAKETTTHPHRYLMNSPFITFDFADATERFWRVNAHKTSLGQYSEIICLAESFNHGASSLKGSYDFILVGLSRGASTILNFMALYNPPQVKALVIESPFDSMETVVAGLARRTGLPSTSSMLHRAMPMIFPHYDAHEIQPIDLVSRIATDLPILIIASQQDRMVPASSSLKLYKKLRASGHDHVYIFIAPYGKHAKILSGESGDDYCYVVHAFYKKYKMPHNETFASRGEALLKLCQPNYHLK